MPEALWLSKCRVAERDRLFRNHPPGTQLRWTLYVELREEAPISREQIWWIEATLSDVPRIRQGTVARNAAFAAFTHT